MKDQKALNEDAAKDYVKDIVSHIENATRFKDHAKILEQSILWLWKNKPEYENSKWCSGCGQYFSIGEQFIVDPKLRGYWHRGCK